MSMAPAVALLFAVAHFAAAADAMPAGALVVLEQELTRKLGEPGLDRESLPYQQYARDFRKRLDAELGKVPPDSINKGLHARILARLGDAESRQAVDALHSGLEADPADHALRASLAIVEFERKNYREAAAAANALLDPSLNPPPPKEVVDNARALWFLAKDRGAGSVKSAPSAPNS